MEHARFFPNMLGEELVLSAHAAFENAVHSSTSAVADRPSRSVPRGSAGGPLRGASLD